MHICDDGSVSYKELIGLLTMQNLGELRANGGTGKNFKSKIPCLESLTLICLYIMHLLWVYTMMVKGCLLLSISSVQRSAF